MDKRKPRSDKGQLLSFVNGPTDSQLFTMFMIRCEKRVDRLVKQDAGISFKILKCMLDNSESESRNDSIDITRKRFIIIYGAAFVIFVVRSFEGWRNFLDGSV